MFDDAALISRKSPIVVVESKELSAEKLCEFAALACTFIFGTLPDATLQPILKCNSGLEESAESAGKVMSAFSDKAINPSVVVPAYVRKNAESPKAIAVPRGDCDSLIFAPDFGSEATT